MPQGQQAQNAGGPLVPFREQAAHHRDALVVGNGHVVVVADEEAVEARIGRGPGPFDDPGRPDAHVGRGVGGAERGTNIDATHGAAASRDDAAMATRDLTALAARRSELRDKYLQPEQDRGASNGGGVHHLALICADPERTIRFYQDLLGFPLVELFENRDYEGSSHFFFDIGAGNMLAFFDFPGLGLEPVPEGLGGVQHVAISVTPETFERLKQKLTDAGVAYIGPDMGVKESVYFKDPDNIQIELIRQPLMEVPESAPQDD